MSHHDGEFIDVSVIFPAYNEAGRLAPAVDKTVRLLREVARSYEIIIAEDGSTDGTDKVASKLSREYSFVKHIHSDRRLGKGQALKEASKKSRGAIIVHMDVDLATNIRHLRELVQSIREGYDFAIGSRLLPGSKVERRLFREFISRAYNLMVRLLFKTGIRDHQCGFKSFKRQALLKVLNEVKANHLFWDTELLVRASEKGYRIREIPVEWKEGKTTKVRLFKDSLSMFLQAFKLWLELKGKRSVLC
ncbi:MAG: glycosyltransferase family 2 protein [Thermoproteota archaeon]